MEMDPRNSHEQVYIDMSIIVIEVKKKYLILTSIWLVDNENFKEPYLVKSV